MSTQRRGLRGLGLFLVVASVLLPLPALAAQAGDSEVTLSIAPSHDVTWEMRVTNVHEESAQVVLDIVSVSGSVFGGDTPASLAITQVGSTVDTADDGRDLEGLQMGLGMLEPGETLALDGRAALPAEADDSYRGATGVVSWRFSLMIDGEVVPPPPPLPDAALPTTGGGMPVVLIAAATGLLIIGAVLARRSRRGNP